MPDQKPWERYASQSAPAGLPAGTTMLAPADPTYQYKGPQASVDLDAARARAAEAAAKAPYRNEIAKAERDKQVAEAALASGKADDARANAALSTMAPNSNVHGEAYFDAIHLPESQRVLARAYARGDLGSRSGGMSTSMLPIIQHAMNYDPTTSATTFPARVKMQQDLAGNQPGTAGGSLRAMEQMVLHGSNVLNSGQQLNNYGPGLLGSIGNSVRTGYLGLTHDPSLNAYEQEVKNYAPESQKGVAGAAGIGAEREERAAGYAGSLPQATRAAALQADARMAMERMGAVNDQYHRLMGRDIVDQLSPAAKKAYDQIMAGGYDPSGNALYPAPGYTPGSVFQGSAGGGDGDGGGNTPTGVGIGSGPGGMTIDPARQKAASQIEAMLANGTPDDRIRAFATAAGASPDSVDANLAFRKNHQNYRGGYDASNLALTPKPKVAFSLAGGTTPVGAFAMSAANALSGNTLDNLAPDPALARAGMAGANTANPVSSALGGTAGTALGAAGTELGIGAAAGKFGLGTIAPLVEGGAARVSPWIARGADALYGGVSGAGAADDGSRLGGAAMGLGLGVGGGMIGRGVVAPALGGMFGAGNRALARARGVEGFGSTAPAALSAGDAAVLAASRKAGIGDITGRLSEAQFLGVPMALADTNPALTSLGGAVVRRSPAASQVAQDALLPRARGQIDRFGSAVERDLGPVANIPQISADLSQQAKTSAGPLYDRAYAAPGASSVDLSDLAQRPSMQAGLGRAFSIAKEEGRDPTSLGFGLDDQGAVTLNRVPSFQSLDYVKRGLDDALEPFRDSMTNKLALNESTRAINNTKNTLLSRVDAVNPDYAAARAAYAGPSQARDALAAGQDAFTANPNQLGVDISGATPERLSQMQVGYRGALMDRANQSRFNANPFDATLGTPAAEQRLATLYPDSAGVPNLLRQRDMEGQLARTNNSILGNSATAERQIADQTFAGGSLPSLALDAGLMATGNVPMATIGRAMGGHGIKSAMALGLGKRAVAKADAIAPTLFNTDPGESLAAIKGLLASDDAYRNYINNLPSRRVLGMFGAGIGAAGGSSLMAPVGP